jgi:hypothetical protein
MRKTEGRMKKDEGRRKAIVFPSSFLLPPSAF